MGNPKGFMTIGRKDAGYRPVNDRIYDYGEVEQTLDDQDRIDQASRCMDCGVPFCHWGCPVGSKIPEWQDLVYRGNWKGAYDILNSTNSFRSLPDVYALLHAKSRVCWPSITKRLPFVKTKPQLLNMPLI